MVVQLWMVKVIAIGITLAGIEGKYCNVCINHVKFGGKGASTLHHKRANFARKIILLSST